jgi:hypothetical protein
MGWDGRVSQTEDGETFGWQLEGRNLPLIQEQIQC